jgi:hypothetical protein
MGADALPKPSTRCTMMLMMWCLSFLMTVQ